MLSPYLAEIYSDVTTGKNLSTGETVGSRDKLCSVQNGTQILNADDLDLGVRNENFTWYQALCYKENDNLSNYYQNMSNYVQPTLEKLKTHFLNEENYIRL